MTIFVQILAYNFGIEEIFVLLFFVLFSDFKSYYNCATKDIADITRTLNISLNDSFFSLLDIVHILLSGKDITALYSWNSEGNQFSAVLAAPYADHITSATAKSLNSSKSLIALSVESNSQIYELTTITNQSDFIPR